MKGDFLKLLFGDFILADLFVCGGVSRPQLSRSLRGQTALGTVFPPSGSLGTEPRLSGLVAGILLVPTVTFFLVLHAHVQSQHWGS